MARTYEQIYAEINEQQAQETALSVLDSTSQVSFWGLIKKQFALLVRLLELRIDNFQSTILATVDAKEKGDLYYYVDKAKTWQYGDNFSVNRFGVYYTTVDTSKRIIAQASAVEKTDEFGAKVQLKAVKSNGNGGLIPLVTAELTSLYAYLAQVKYAGIRVEVLSQVADTLVLSLTVKVNRSVGNLDGTLITDPTFKPVESAIKAFIQQLPFDSVFRWRELETYLMTFDFCEDCSITASSVTVGSTTTDFVMSTVSVAGHFTLSEDSEITYL